MDRKTINETRELIDKGNFVKIYIFFKLRSI